MPENYPAMVFKTPGTVEKANNFAVIRKILARAANDLCNFKGLTSHQNIVVFGQIVYNAEAALIAGRTL